MALTEPNIRPELPVIRQLDDGAINRIAAGEVIERPASAIKELVENALDAGATRIDVTIADGGKTLMRVVDDGHGIPVETLPLAMARHATSKIDGRDLLNIRSFGFRGEALPSLGAVGRMTVTSRATGAGDAAMIRVAGGVQEAVRPAALNLGTTVELRDLFYATPARLKFLRTDRAEAQAIGDVVKRLAMAEPFVGFTLTDVSGGGQRRVLRFDAETGDLFDALAGRLRRILGTEFTANALRIEAERDGFALSGYASLPTYSRGAAVHQYLSVNGRPVKDKLLVGALRGAYSDLLSRDRHPVVALNIACAPQLVDVNVHPAKSEVRFRDPALVRGLIVSGLKHALAEAGHRASTSVATAALGLMREGDASEPARIYQMERPAAAPSGPRMTGFAEAAPVFARTEPVAEDAPLDHPLGAARAQLHENYLVTQTADGIVIVDQHAAHERIVYERLKAEVAAKGVARQALLIPEVIDLSADAARLLLAHAETLLSAGLVIEPFGGAAIVVRETPAILGVCAVSDMIQDVLDELQDLGDTQSVQDKVAAILSRVACHGSIRSGRRMQAEEMNALLREMEVTPNAGQCNHGRPTYVELKLADIERLFGRT